MHVEVPAHWPGILAPGDPLPACSATPPVEYRVVTVTVTGPGGSAQSMDNCAYLHAVATTTTGYAMSFSAAGGAGAADMTTLLVVGIGAAALLLIIGGLLLARRRRAARATPPSA